MLRIKELREDHDLSQREISQIISVARTTYSNYENNKVRIPVDTLIKLAQYYDVNLDYIAGITSQKKKFPTK